MLTINLPAGLWQVGVLSLHQMESTLSGIVRMRDIRFDPELFRNYTSGTVLDELLCSYKGLPKGVNYMVIGDPGVGKTTIILDLLSNIRKQSPGVRVLFISAEMNEIDLAIYVQRFPKFQDLDILEGDDMVPRKADLRAFVLMADEALVWKSGLTRFSRNPDSFIVNSSQGGGFKDTWVLSQ